MEVMETTDRQKEIFNRLVDEYINTAQPVSSQLLEKKYGFGLCPATIRNEMQKLTDDGLIFQPHTSAGRVPTEKGYRFFVDNLLEKGFEEDGFDLGIESLIEKEMGDTFKTVQTLTKSLAESSSNLALSFLADDGILWKEGWEELLCAPEFRETKIISSFARLLKEFENEIEDFDLDSGIKVYIGRENPFLKSGDFSIIVSGCSFPKKKKAVVAIAGPTRMLYQRNINSLNHLKELLNSL